MKKNMENGAWIKRVSPELSPPSLKDNTADLDRLIKGIKKGLGGGRGECGFRANQRSDPLSQAVRL